MCLGENARNANKAAKRQYEYQLKQRERKWKNELGLMKLQRVQYDHTLDALHVGLGNTYAELQGKYRDLIGEARQQDEVSWQEFNQDRKSASLAASGRTGRSIDRISTVELGQYLRSSNRRAYQLTKAKQVIDAKGAEAAGAVRQQQLQAFINNNIVRSPDLAPPKPVMQDVRNAAFMDALSIGGSILGMGANVVTIFGGGGGE